MMATTAVVSNDMEKRLMSSQSQRSVATPSKLNPELASHPEGEAASVNATPRRLPPLEPSQGAESESSDGVSLPSRLPPIPEPAVEPVAEPEAVVPISEPTAVELFAIEESPVHDYESIQTPPESEHIYMNT